MFKRGQQVRVDHRIGTIEAPDIIRAATYWLVRFDDGQTSSIPRTEIADIQETCPQADAQDVPPAKELAMPFHCGQQVKTNRGIGTVVMASLVKGTDRIAYLFQVGQQIRVDQNIGTDASPGICWVRFDDGQIFGFAAPEITSLQETSSQPNLLDATLWLTIVTTIALLSWFLA